MISKSLIKGFVIVIETVIVIRQKVVAVVISHLEFVGRSCSQLAS